MNRSSGRSSSSSASCSSSGSGCRGSEAGSTTDRGAPDAGGAPRGAAARGRPGPGLLPGLGRPLLRRPRPAGPRAPVLAVAAGAVRDRDGPARGRLRRAGERRPGLGGLGVPPAAGRRALGAARHRRRRHRSSASTTRGATRSGEGRPCSRASPEGRGVLVHSHSVGFVGGGRITAIFLQALGGGGLALDRVTVSDTSAEVLLEAEGPLPGDHDDRRERRGREPASAFSWRCTRPPSRPFFPGSGPT